MNRVILKGRLTSDVELKQTANNISVVRATLAVNRDFKDKESGEYQTDFISIQAWRKTAEFLAKYTSKGQEILIEGALHNNNYEKSDGTKVYGYIVTAERAEFCGAKGSNGSSSETPNNSNSLGDLSGFEEILSDGDIPF